MCEYFANPSGVIVAAMSMNPRNRLQYRLKFNTRDPVLQQLLARYLASPLDIETWSDTTALALGSDELYPTLTNLQYIIQDHVSHLLCRSIVSSSVGADIYIHTPPP